MKSMFNFVHEYVCVVFILDEMLAGNDHCDTSMSHGDNAAVYGYDVPSLGSHPSCFICTTIYQCKSLSIYWFIDMIKERISYIVVGRGGALVKSIAFNRRVVGSTPAVATM